MTNLFPGLATGPVDHEATSVINAISNSEIDMGDAVELVTTIPPEGELLPRVKESITLGTSLVYGIAVGGNADGIYGDGAVATDDTTKATFGAGEAVQVVTRGRCPARVVGVNSLNQGRIIIVGDPLTVRGGGIGDGELILATLSTQTVIARALELVPAGGRNVSVVEVNYEGKF